MVTKESSIIEQKVSDFMSVNKYKELIKTEPVSTTVNFLYLKKVVESLSKLSPEEVVITMAKDKPVLIKTLTSDSGIVLSNIECYKI